VVVVFVVVGLLVVVVLLDVILAISLLFVEDRVPVVFAVDNVIIFATESLNMVVSNVAVIIVV
jgi:hypothetical protein